MQAKEAQGVAVYSRKSKFTGKGESIENQIELCKQYIRDHFGDRTAQTVSIYEDEGFSGGNLERPQFKAMMRDARHKKFTALICYRLDRISRNIGDFANLIEELNHLGISFVSIKEQFDTTSPMGRAMMYIASVFSQLERETIAERIRDNMYELAKTGRWLGGVTPTGYLSESVEHITVDGKVKKACRLKQIPAEAVLVELIFKQFLICGSLSKTEIYLLCHGHTSKNGRPLSRFAIKNILSNPVYMQADEDAYRYFADGRTELFAERAQFDGEHGLMVYNRTSQKPGQTHQLRDRKDWIVAVGSHTGIVSGACWLQAQELLAQNKSKSYRQPQSHVALLSGLLFCASCGSPMRPKLTKRQNAEGERVYTYLCARKETSRRNFCTMPNAAGNLLDEAVCGVLYEVPIDWDERKRQLAQHKTALPDNREGPPAEIAHMRRCLTENEKEMKGLLAVLPKAAGTAAENYIIGQIDALHAKGEKLQERLTELQNSAARHPLTERELAEITKRLASLPDLLAALPIRQKRIFIRSLVQKVVWDGHDAHLYLLGAEVTQAPQDAAVCGGDVAPQGEDSK